MRFRPQGRSPLLKERKPQCASPAQGLLLAASSERAPAKRHLTDEGMYTYYLRDSSLARTVCRLGLHVLCVYLFTLGLILYLYPWVIWATSVVASRYALDGAAPSTLRTLSYQLAFLAPVL